MMDSKSKSDTIPANTILNDDIILTSGTAFTVVQRKGYQVQVILKRLSEYFAKKGYQIDQNVKFYHLCVTDIDYVNGVKFQNSTYFPTEYSMKNQEQFFCQLFSYYLDNKLNNDKAKKFMNEILEK